MQKIIAIGSTCALTLGFAFSAAALDVGGTTSADLDTSVSSNGVNVQAGGSATGSATSNSSGAGVSGSTGSEVNGSLNVDGAMDPAADAATGISGYVRTMLGTGDSVSGEGTTNASAEGTVEVDLGGAVRVTRADVENNAAAATTLSAASVESDTDLTGYFAAQIQNDEKIERIESNGGNVSVTYEADAQFLGFIPSTVNITATVTAEGDVEVKYPWYSFLFSKASKAELEAAIQERVNAMFAASGSLSGTVVAPGADVSADASASVEAQSEMATRLAAEAKARVVEEIRTALATELAAEAQADAAASADASL